MVEAHPEVAAWAKNDHLGFSILYLWNGSKRKYIPDFLVRYKSGKTLVLEIRARIHRRTKPSGMHWASGCTP